MQRCDPLGYKVTACLSACIFSTVVFGKVYALSLLALGVQLLLALHWQRGGQAGREGLAGLIRHLGDNRTLSSTLYTLTYNLTLPAYRPAGVSGSDREGNSIISSLVARDPISA